MKLPRSFYARPALSVAPTLLGKILVHDDGKVRRQGRIVEVEAYCGPKDLASHARFGPTPRAAIMFGPPAVAYVYLIYGMHHCMNVVCETDGTAGAVLIRGLDLEGASGPGRLCRTLGITREHNGTSLVADEIWIEDDGAPPPRIARTPRIGVDYAGAWAKKPYRFISQPRASRPGSATSRRRRARS